MDNRERIAQLRDEYARIEEELRALEAEERRDRLEVERTRPLTNDDFIDPFPQYTGNRPFVLPFGRDFKKWNPQDPSSHPFGQEWLADSFALICQREDEPRSRPTRLIHSSGRRPSPEDRVGNSFDVRHDQTGSFLGTYRVVGIATYGPDGRLFSTYGEVPSTKLSLSTYK